MPKVHGWTSMIECVTLEVRGRQQPSRFTAGSCLAPARSLPRSAGDNPRIITGQFAPIPWHAVAGSAREVAAATHISQSHLRIGLRRESNKVRHHQC